MTHDTKDRDRYYYGVNDIFKPLEQKSELVGPFSSSNYIVMLPVKIGSIYI